MKMTLHEAIEKLIQEVGKPMTTKQIADELNQIGWYQKKDNSQISKNQISSRARKYKQLFNMDGSTISMQTSARPTQNNTQTIVQGEKQKRDEDYVLDLCDEVLGLLSSRQHKFDFLRGDKNKKGVAKQLPVDSFYPELKLVVEYHERQHTEENKFFDNKMTISGVPRGEQREIYDERRRTVLPEHNIHLVEISFYYFNYDSNKRIVRNREADIEVVKLKLKDFLKK